MPILPPTHSTKVNAPTHQSKQQKELFARIRGRKLMRIRDKIFRRDPMCVECLKMKPQRVSKSVIVDHIIPLHLGGSDTDDNRQGLCEDCHKIKTGKEATIRSFNPGIIKKPETKTKTYTVV